MLNSDQHRSALQVGLGVASPLWPAFAFAASTGAAFWWLSQMSFGRWRPEPYNVEALHGPPEAAAEAAAVIVDSELEIASAALEPANDTKTRPATGTVAEAPPAKAAVATVEERIEAAPEAVHAAAAPVKAAHDPAKVTPAPLVPAPAPPPEKAAAEPAKAAAPPAKPVAEPAKVSPGSAATATPDAKVLAKTEVATVTAPAAESAPAAKAEAATKPAAITPSAPVAKALTSAKPPVATKATASKPSPAKAKPTTAKS